VNIASPLPCKRFQVDSMVFPKNIEHAAKNILSPQETVIVFPGISTSIPLANPCVGFNCNRTTGDHQAGYRTPFCICLSLPVINKLLIVVNGLKTIYPPRFRVMLRYFTDVYISPLSKGFYRYHFEYLKSVWESNWGI